MESFEGRAGSRRAAKGQAVKICHGWYLSEEPTAGQLARMVTQRWPDCALDGYSAAQASLGEKLSFPLYFLRAGTMAKSPYFHSRRARPKETSYIDGVRVCGPLQAVEAMSLADAIAFIEAHFDGKHGRAYLAALQSTIKRLPRHTRAVLAQAIVGADSVPERALTRALAPHVAVRNNVPIGPYRWDLVLDEHKVAIEVDGYVYHNGEGRERFEIDRQKLNDAVQRGWRPLHFTATTIEHHLDAAVGQVLAIVRGRGSLVRPPWDWHHLWRYQQELEDRGRWAESG